MPLKSGDRGAEFTDGPQDLVFRVRVAERRVHGDHLP